MKALFNFGLSQEDERTEAAALELGAPDGVLSIASAGDMPLSLLALGAGRVTAVDVDPGQLHLAWLKVASVAALDREAAIRFLGFMPASSAERDRSFAAVARELPEASRRFWDDHRAVVRGGAIWAGRYERFVRRVVRTVRPALGRRIEGLFDCSDLPEQEAYFGRELDRPWLRLIFRVVFHPKVFARRGMDPQSLRHRSRDQSIADQYFDQFRWFCTNSPARLNPHLQVHLLGRVLSTDAVPAYLEREGFQRAREALGRLQLLRGDLVEHLEACERGTYDKVHLSNVPDWLPRPAFEQIMRLLADRLEPRARLVWRSLHTDYPLPDELRDRVELELALGRELRRRDRFPFYDIIPAAMVDRPSRSLR